MKKSRLPGKKQYIRGEEGGCWGARESYVINIDLIKYVH